MLATNSNISALEWFFRRPPASNFPLAASSPELLRLRNATKQLCETLSNSQDIKFKDYSLTFSKWLGNVEVMESIERLLVENFIDHLDSLIKYSMSIKDTSTISDIQENIKTTVIALALFAKTSQDINFSKQVINLGKSLYSIR